MREGNVNFVNLKEIGVCNARGMTTYFSFDQTRTFATYRREGSVVTHSRTIDELFQSRIDARDDRKFVAVLEGSFEYLQKFRTSLETPHLVVYVSTREILYQLKVKVVDEDWKPGAEKIDLNNYLGEI